MYVTASNTEGYTVTLSEPTQWRQVAKYGNLKRRESWSFSGDIESLEPSKF